MPFKEILMLKRIISLLICLIMVATCLVACSDGEETTEAPASDTSNDAVVELLTLISGGASEYEIVYPQQSTAQEANFITSFTALFKEKTGIVLKTTNDLLKPGESYSDDDCKIFVGATNYPVSEEAMSEIQYESYRIITKGSNIVFAAYSNTGFDEIIKWFKKNVLTDYAGGDLTMQAADVSGSLFARYPVENWVINGNSLKNYQIVYHDKDISKAVSELQMKLAQKSGWYLKAGIDSELPQSEYEILIGETDRSESASVGKPLALNYTAKVVGNKLVIKYGGIHSKVLLMEILAEVLIDGKSNINMDGSYELCGDFYDDPHDTALADNADLRIMSANLMANSPGYDDGALTEHGFLFERRVEIFHAHIDYYQPTVIGFQEACTFWYDAIDSYDDIDSWEVLKFPNPEYNNNEYIYSSLMYRKDLYNLIESGAQIYSAHWNARCRWYTWAILEDKYTGYRFCVVSTHWEPGVDAEPMLTEANELATFVNNIASTKHIPVFTMGDFNCSERYKTWQDYKQNIDSYDCMLDIGDRRVNIWDSWHGWGTSDPVGVHHNAIDHITATKSDVEVLRFETLAYLQQIWASDHSWLLCDFEFK